MRYLKVCAFVFALAACNNHANVQCETSANCDLSPGGMCVAAPSGHTWCAYPDSACPAGYRYSDHDVGDGLAGACVPSNDGDAAVHDAPADSVDARLVDAPPAHFVVTYGGANLEKITDMHGVSDGLIFSGLVQSSCMLNTTQLSPGYVVAKTDTSGSVVWARPQTYTDNLMLGGTGTTAAGDVIVAGAFVGSVNFGGTTLVSNATNWDVFIAKYSGTNGSHVWSVRYGAAGPEKVSAVVVDAAGDVYISGYWNGTGNYGGADVTSAGGDDFFIAKYSGTNGSYLWGLHNGSAMGNDYANGLAVDSNGVYACGPFRQTINLGGSNLTSAGADDIFVASFNPTNGNHRWSESFGSSVTTSNDSCNNLIASGGGVYMTGSFTNPLSIGGTAFNTQGSADIYLGKYDAATGSHVWSRPYGGTGLDVPARLLAVGTNVVVTGRFQQTINYTGGSISSAGGDDVFVQTVAQSDGSYVDAFRTGGSSNDEGTALATVGGVLVVGGGFQGVSYFGTTQKTSAGMEDAFVYEP